jgi:hypothetical protein
LTRVLAVLLAPVPPEILLVLGAAGVLGLFAYGVLLARMGD